MNRTYQYRLYPNCAQAEALDGLLWRGRTLYNAALEQRIKAYRGESRMSVGYYDQTADWTELRGADPWFRTLNATAGQQVLRRLDKSFQRFFKADSSGKKAGFPRFKGQNQFRSMEFVRGDGARIKGDRLYVQNVGHIKTKWHRPIPDDAKIKQVRLIKRASGWHAQFVLELPTPEIGDLTGVPIGIDLGIKAAVATSDGLVSLPVRPYRDGEAKLRRAQRKVARRTRGSNRRRKAVAALARLHERIANQRRDQLHKIARGVVDGASVIALEDLHLAFMLKNRHLAKAASDTALGMLTEFIEYKAESAGIQVIKVDPKNTSQACSGCGVIVKKSLGVRIHVCPECGLVEDRDVNAAKNVLKKARMEPSGVNGGQS